MKALLVFKTMNKSIKDEVLGTVGDSTPPRSKRLALRIAKLTLSYLQNIVP